MRILACIGLSGRSQVPALVRKKWLSRFPADAIEAAVPDVDAAAAILFSRRPELPPWLARWQRQLVAAFGDTIREDATRAGDALCIALARMGQRYGSWSADYHAYHNENHALELLDGRLGRLIEHTQGAINARDRIALALFSSCHDLRQRETGETGTPVGANEAASIAEAARILALAGFDEQRDEWLYRSLELSIAGSTFDAAPLPPDSRSNTAELAARGGPLAPKLGEWLDTIKPAWRDDPTIVHALDLAQTASDLDTGNVAEPLLELVASSIRLCEEREMRAGRALGSLASAEACLAFLTDGQERYFFQLHRFCSERGRAAFAAGKAANAKPLRALVNALRRHYADGPAADQCGLDVIRHFARLALHHSH